MASAVRQFHPKLCLLGAPGSGKGSYGKILARHWRIPIITVSDILKQRQQSSTQDAAISSGKLVDDHIVSQALLDYFEEQEASTAKTTNLISGGGGYILDGFPRTIQQIQIMDNAWPDHLKINAAVHLNVPAHVCERKLLGRRICTICGNNYNVNGVLFDGFDLPPKLPHPGECHPMHQSGVTSASLPQQHMLASRSSTTSSHRCVPATAKHWKQRDDDQVDIIHHRLLVYKQHTEPILEHFRRRGKLFEFIPYKGFDDMPKFQSQLEEWVVDKFPSLISEGSAT